MRTTVFLSTLFAVTLLGGAALADKPQAAAPVKAPRTIEKLRVHGDVVDKSYRAPSAAMPRGQDFQQVAPARQHVRPPTSKGESRVYCSEIGADCHTPRVRDKASNLEPTASKGDRNVRPPAFLDKILGSDRMSCNEADECSMSNRAVKRAWSRAAAEGSAGATSMVGAPDAKPSQLEKIRTQRSKPEARVSCNEADECSMDHKSVAREWAKASLKAGTFKAPEQKSPTPAEVAIAESKKQKK